MGTLTLQGQDFHLNPCPDLGDEKDTQFRRYNENFSRILKDNFEEDYLVRFTAKPFIDPEFAFQIRKIDSMNYELSAVVFTENLWDAHLMDSVKADVQNRHINRTLAVKIDALFNVFIDSVLKNEIIVTVLDGTSYTFSHKTENTEKCGETSDPIIDSPLGELVGICEVLMKYAKGEDIDLKKLDKRISKLYCQKSI